MQKIYSAIIEAQKSGQRVALCIVIETSGSTPQKAGSKMLVYEDGHIVGTIGGGSVEKQVIEKSLEILKTSMPQKINFNLEADLSMHCGGGMEVYIEPINSLPKLYIWGAGHVGKAVANIARNLGFNISIIDFRENIFSEEELKSFTCVQKDYFKAISEISFDQNTYSVIVTPNHSFDEDVLAKLAKLPHTYIGMIGSARKVELLKKRFLSEQILTSDELLKIDMPIGIKMAAETPEEIAISIAAKLVDVKNTLNK
jgi:xanthine dehydrogenase accessory factor